MTDETRVNSSQIKGSFEIGGTEVKLLQDTVMKSGSCAELLLITSLKKC